MMYICPPLVTAACLCSLMGKAGAASQLIAARSRLSQLSRARPPNTYTMRNSSFEASASSANSKKLTNRTGYETEPS